MIKLPEWFGRRQTLQRRISWLSALAVGLAVLCTGLAAYFFTSYALYDQLDRELVQVATYEAGVVAADLQTMGGLNADALKAANAMLVVVGADNSKIQVPGEKVQLNIAGDEVAIARTQTGFSARTGTGSDGQRYRIVAVPLPVQADQGNRIAYALVIARPLAPTVNMLQQLAWILILFGSGMMIVGGLAGAWVARSGLQPVRRLSESVATITETDELTPLPVEGNDEITELARSFNTMLFSLESSRERQRRLIADAGHELRTPLTSLRTNIELLVADEKAGMLPAGARGEILLDVASQLSEFTSLVGDLVQLSRDEHVSAAPEPIDLRDIVTNAVTRARRRGPGLHFDVNLSPLYLVGEPDQLERAITNLLDNAVKFSPPGGTVHVTMSGDTLKVDDEGPGIAEEDLPHIFDRFYRSDQARNTPGTGLGLSIVSHTINAHGGSVWAGRAPGGGAEFTVRLPGTTNSPEDDDEATVTLPRINA